MKYASIITIIAIFVYLVFSTAEAMAVSPADFPACSNPQGSLIASYDSGTHGIVGSSGVYSGSDKVYQIDSQKVTQCFCPLDGNGIQTNWVKAGSLTIDEQKIHERDGWTFIPTGKVWGLEDVSYYAKNHDFACPGSGGSAGNSQSSSSGGGSSSGTSTGIVEASSAVLGLAGTGNTITLLSIATTGLVAFSLSFLLKKTK